MAARRPRATAQPCPPFTRRRGQVLERAIFDAVLDQLRAEGYGGLTMEGVAACAHTGKAALYRRWGSKEELVVDALQHALPPVGDPPDHGSVRDDLLALLRQMASLMSSPAGCAMQAVLGEGNRDRAFVEVVRRRVIEPRRRMFLEVLRRGAERGEVRPEAVSPLVAEIGPAMLVQRFHSAGPPIPDDYVVSVVDGCVLPLLRP
jgi:AcrR family transcriptional regulator